MAGAIRRAHEAGRQHPGSFVALPVQQPGQPAVPPRHHRRRNLGADGRPRRRHSLPASAPAAPSPASPASSRSTTRPSSPSPSKRRARSCRADRPASTRSKASASASSPRRFIARSATAWPWSTDDEGLRHGQAAGRRRRRPRRIERRRHRPRAPPSSRTNSAPANASRRSSPTPPNATSPRKSSRTRDWPSRRCFRVTAMSLRSPKIVPRGTIRSVCALPSCAFLAQNYRGRCDKVGPF